MHGTLSAWKKRGKPRHDPVDHRVCRRHPSLLEGYGIVENRFKGNPRDCWSAETGFPQPHSLDNDEKIFNNYSKKGLDST